MITPKIKATNIELTEAIRSHVDTRLQSIEKFLPNDTDALCEVEVERTTVSDGETFRAEFNLTYDGTMHRSEERTNDLYVAIDTVRDEIVREIRQSQSKRRDFMRKGGAKVKAMMRQLKF
jgi:ribosomal subunit interface protein